MERKKLVVIVDDEEDLLDLFEYNLAREGFAVEAFDRAGPALAFIRDNRPDIILCDWMMPEMTGLEFCQQVKSSLPMADIPFMMVTCRQESEARLQALSAGVTDFVVKPVPMQDLLSRIQTILHRDLL
ncbi:MAG: response regulator [Bacteroidia bacterium]|nr:response regulator [Bacteroidia bacterium]